MVTLVASEKEFEFLFEIIPPSLSGSTDHTLDYHCNPQHGQNGHEAGVPDGTAAQTETRLLPQLANFDQHDLCLLDASQAR